MGKALTAGDIMSQGPNYITIHGDDGTNNNDVVIDTAQKYPIAQYNKWSISTANGVVDILVDHGSGTYTTAPLSLFDQGGTAWATMVLVTVVDRTYSFFGSFEGIKVLQNGAGAAEDVWLRGWN